MLEVVYCGEDVEKPYVGGGKYGCVTWHMVSGERGRVSVG